MQGSLMRSETVKFGTLDGMRGLAAILIAMRHTGAFFKPIDFTESFLAVDLFFVLSGVVICHAYEARIVSGLSIGRFAWVRLVRIYPLYFVGAALAVGAHALQGDWPGDLSIQVALVLIPDLAATMLFPLNGPAWSLFFELVANVAYAALVRSLTPRRIAGIIAVAAVMMVVLVFIGRRHSLDIGWTVKSIAGGFARVAFSFTAGVAIHRLYAGQAAPPRLVRLAAHPLVPCLLLAVVGTILTSAPAPALQPYYELATVILVFPALVYLSLFCQPQGHFATLCQLAGLVSYPLYAIHAPIGQLMEAGFGAAIGDHAPWIGIPFLAALLAFCAALAHGYDAPVRRYLLRRTAARRSSAVNPASLNVASAQRSDECSK